MRLLLCVFTLLFHFSNVYAQSQKTEPVKSGQVIATNEQKARQAKTKKVEEFKFIPLKDRNVWSHPTFQPYQARKTISSDIAVWKDRYQIPQKEYKVSLVGMNINTWLENPLYFNTLETEALKYSVYELLDNLISYNPTLSFNDPKVVANAIHKNIYHPYLQNITNHFNKNLNFADINRVVSYTRRFHIYGVSAGGLPYFGRPMEGGQREINLGLLSGQLPEIAVKLPETDIFLVAMINVIPNWLEEGLNVFQVHQQELEILIYAFDRKGKLIGGTGVPMNFIHNGNYYVMEQKIRSKVWQPGTSRMFYITPSFNMMNNKETNVSASLNIEIPTDVWPKLDGYKKYILSAIDYLRAENKSINVELFNSDGDKLVKLKKSVKPKYAKLANRILAHKDSTLLVNTKIEFPSLQQGTLLVRLNNENEKESSSKQKKSSKSVISKRNYPSNEGRKLESLLIYGREMILQKPLTHNNQLYYTNDILPYELESDPIVYSVERKKYTVLNYSLREVKKEYNKKTKDIIKNEQLNFKEKIFWEQFKFDRLKALGLLTKDMTVAFDEWLDKTKQLHSISIKKINIDRKVLIPSVQEKQLSELKVRNEKFLSEKYAGKNEALQKSLAKFKIASEKLLANLKEQQKNEELISNQQEINQQVAQLKKEENLLYDKLTKLYPLKVNYAQFSKDEKTINLNNLDRGLLKYNQKAFETGTDSGLVKMAIAHKKYSPLFKQARKNEKEKLKNKYHVYEGFMLGLTRAWKVKTRLEDRMSYL